MSSVTAHRVPSYLIVFLGALVALGPLSMDAYLPAIPTMVVYFDSDIVSLNNTLAIFLIGYAIGQFFGGSLSDQIGRKRIGYIGLSVYIATTFSMAFAKSVDQLLVLRFFQAIGGGFSTVICMASVRDLYPLEELGRRFATITMIVLVAPLIAPTLGSLLLPFGWWMIFVLISTYALLLLILYRLLIPETRPGAWSDISMSSVLRQCRDVIVRRVDGVVLPIRYALAMALSAALLMTFVTNASFVYMEYFGVSPSVFPLIFGLSVVGFMSLNLLSMRRLTSSNAGRFFRIGLRLQIAGAVLLGVVVVAGVASLWTIVPLVVLTIATMGLVGPAGSARYMSHFSQLAGSASSVYTTLMFSLGGICGWLAGALFNGSLVPVIAVMLAATCLANLIASTIPKRA